MDSHTRVPSPKIGGEKRNLLLCGESRKAANMPSTTYNLEKLTLL